MTCPMMMSLGVYLLGAADAHERERLEAHLPACQACRAELGRLAPLPGLLAGIPEAMRETASAPGQGINGMVVREISRPARAGISGRASTRGRGASTPMRELHRRGARMRRAAAAAVCLVAAAVTGGLWLSSANGDHQASVLTLTGANPATHVSATVTLTATSWGSSVQLQVRGLPENVDCRLIVHSLTGKTEVSGVWNAWQKGPVSIPGSISLLPSDIANLQVATPTQNLLTISTHPATRPATRARRGVQTGLGVRAEEGGTP